MVIDLVNKIPENQLRYVLAYLQDLTAYEAVDDAFCQQRIDEYEKSPNQGERMSFEEVCEQCGVDILLHPNEITNCNSR